jgi:branched-chain amino acid aminotransferase
MNYYLADQEAQLVDSGASALLLDLDGNVTETSGANLFLVDDGTLVSPTTRNTLPGVSRATVFELAHQVGMRVAERDIQVHSVINAEEAFTTSTSYCMLPVTKLNGIRIGSGLPGPNFQRLLRAWSARVGVDIEHQITIGQQWRRS